MPIGRPTPYVGPQPPNVLHLCTYKQIMTCTRGTILFVQKLLIICLISPKKDILLTFLTMQIYDEITVKNTKSANLRQFSGHRIFIYNLSSSGYPRWSSEIPSDPKNSPPASFKQLVCVIGGLINRDVVSSWALSWHQIIDLLWFSCHSWWIPPPRWYGAARNLSIV